MKLQLNITGKLAVTLVLFGAALLGSLGTLAYTSGRAGLQDAATSELLSIELEKQSALERWFTEARTGITAKAASPVVLEQAAALLAAAPGSPEALAAHDRLIGEFQPIVGLPAAFLDVFFIEAETGEVLAAVDPREEGKFKENQSYFINGKSEPFVSEVYYSTSLSGPAIAAAAPVVAKDGRLLGVVAGQLDVNNLNSLISQHSGLRQTDDTYLVNTSGLLVTQPRFISDPAVLQKTLKTEAVTRCLEGNNGLLLYDDYGGHAVIGAYRWLPAYRVCLISKFDQAEAFAPSLAFGRTVTWASGLALVLALALSIVLARTFTRPILALEAGAKRLGQGDLEYRVAVKSQDEVGRLTVAFNEMAEKLQYSQGQMTHSQHLLLALSQAAQTVLRAHTPEEVYRAVGEAVTGLGYHAVIFNVSEDPKRLTLAHLTFESGLLRAAEKLAGLSAQGFHFEIQPGSVHYQVVVEGKTLFFDRAEESIADALPNFARPLVGHITALLGIEQIIYAPLTSDGVVVGLLEVVGKGLTETDAPAITTVANQTAIALENVRLVMQAQDRARELERRVNDLSALNTTARIVSESVDAQEICSRALDEVLTLVDVNAGALLLLDPASGDMVMTAHRGLTDEFVQAAGRMKPGEGLTWQVAAAGKPAVMPDMSKYPGALKAYVDKEHIQSAAVIPLMGRTGVVGTMNLAASQPRTFEAASLELLTAVGRQIAIGLEKAQLYAALQEELAEHRRTEEELRQSEEHFRLLVEGVTEYAILMLNSTGCVVSWNPGAERIEGYRADEIIGQHFSCFYPADDVKRGKPEQALAIAIQERQYRDEGWRVRKDGSQFMADVTLSALFDEAGELRGFVKVTRDITERKEAEAALRESEARFRHVVAAIPEHVYVSEMRGEGPAQFVDTYLSPRVEALTGYPRQMLLDDWPFWLEKVVHPDDREAEYAHVARLLTGQASAVEYRVVRADGRVIWVRDSARLETGVSGIKTIYGVVADITESKQAEAALRESEAALRGIVNANTDSVFLLDHTGTILVVNEATAKKLGRRADELPGANFAAFLPPDLAEARRVHLEEAVRSAKTVVWEDERQGIFFENCAYPIANPQGEIMRMAVYARDITERKQAEQALRRSHDLLDRTGQMAKVGSWELDVETQTLSWTEEVYRIHEVDPTTRPALADGVNFYAPEARPVIAAAVQAGIDSGTPWDLELPLITAQGRRIWVRAQGAAERRGGKTVCLYGAFQDITERKQAEQLQEALYTISQAAIAAENLEDFYLSIHRALGSLMSAENFYIALYDPDTDLISYPYFVDQYDEPAPPKKPGRGLTEYVLRTGQPLYADPQVFAQLVQQGEVELVGADSVDWLGVPLKVGAKISGVMTVQSYTARVRFGSAETKILEFVAVQVATTIVRKLAQQRIADALEFNNMLIEASTLGISAYDASGQCVLANEAIARIVGATHEQVLGQNYNQIESWKKSGLIESAREAVASGHETRREIHTKSTFGKEMWLDCRFTPFVLNGEPHLMLTTDDVSIPKQAEVALQVYASKLEQSNRDLQEFAYVASHDLQEPLRKVLAFGDRLAKKYDAVLDDAGRDYLKRMHDASQRMQTLINDLLSFSRVSTRAQPFTQVDLNTLAQEVISDLENHIERTGGRVEIGDLPTIEADPTQMHQLLQNLISNALKFRKDNIPPTIQVSAQIKDRECQISVKDNGIGFDLQYLDRIFKPFQRLHTREAYEGSGMGLAICHRIVERHGGRITATSTPGAGSTFIITLPLQQSTGDSAHV